MRNWLSLAILLLAGLASFNAYATRETPSIRSSSLTRTAGAQSESVSIPASTTNVVITFYWTGTSSNAAPTSVSLDGQSATKKVSNEIAGAAQIAVYTASGVTTGAGKTFAWTNGSGYTSLDASIEFRDGTATYGATDTDNCTSCGTLTTASLANNSGDELLCAYMDNAGSITSVGAGQTQLDDTSGDNQYGYTTKTGTGTSTTNSFTMSGGQVAYGCIVISLSAAAPAFSVVPAYATVSNTQISATFTANAASLTYYCALYLKGAAAPTAAQVAAGTNAHSAVITGRTTGASEAHNITASDSPSNPSYDPYCVVYNGTTYSAVPTTSTTATTAPTGFSYVTLASVTATGSIPKAANDADWITLGYDTQTANFTVGSVVVDSTSGAWGYIQLDVDMGAAGVLTIDKRSGTFADNDVLYDQGGAAALVNGAEAALTSVAVNDVLVASTTVSPSAAATTVTTSGQYSYTAVGRQTALNQLFFHDATQAYISLDADLYFDNTAPHCGSAQTEVFKHGEVVDYDVSALCSDFDNDTLKYARITSLPAGLTLNPTTGHITGTVNTDATTAVSIIVYDAAGDYTTQSISMTVATSYTMPNCSAITESACANTILSTTSGSVFINVVSQCSATVASGYVISETPAAGASISPGDTATLVKSVGNICSIRSPDCTSSPTTTAECETLYLTAFSNVVRFAPSSRCNNSVASGYVISTSPKAHTEMAQNANVGIVSSLGTCSTTAHPMVNCISHTVAECLGLLDTRFGAGVVTLQSTVANCPAGYASGDIFAQAPGSGKRTRTPATLSVRYCQ